MDPASPLLFVINAASGHKDPGTTRRAIEATLTAAGRTGEFLPAGPDELTSVAQHAVAMATARHTAVVVVGGDGTINSVAQPIHAAGCAMGVVPEGTFNYFARTHGIPSDAAEATELLLRAVPAPVQVGLINDRVFLVNASLGLYPELLQDREAYKARFGRSRFVAFGAALITLLGQHRQLRIRVELGADARDVTTLTLFIANNRLQLEEVGLPEASALDEGCLAAVTLRPSGAVPMLWLLFRGAIGTLGEVRAVESFKFHRMVATPRLALGRRAVKVAYDGEVSRMRVPLEFRVAAKPLYLLKPTVEEQAADHGSGQA
jgi:diacylglycerol kinase family enzyme